MAYLCITTSQGNIWEEIVNVGMAGEFKEIGETFLQEDSYEFDIVQFRNTEDKTLNTLIYLFDEMDKARETIKNTHDITDEEIKLLLPDWLALNRFYHDDNDEFDDLNDLENPDDMEDLDG